MKAILISIKPKWVAKILNGEKTIEIRKTCPTQLRGDTPVKPEPIDVYIYCTKDKTPLYYDKYEYYADLEWVSCPYKLNGKVVAKFTLNKVEEIPARIFSVCTYPYTKTLDDYELLDKSCLLTNELETYLGNNIGYAWHISNLVIFDKPKELIEFYFSKEPKKELNIPKGWKQRITKAPQSWCYVEELL